MSDQWKSHLKSLGSVLGQATRTATDVAKDLSRAVAQELGAVRCLQSYSVEGQVCTAGPGGLWRVYAAKARKPGAPHPTVSVWVLTKRQAADLDGQQGLSSAQQVGSRAEAYFAAARRGFALAQRLQHPGLLRVVEPLEETRSQLVAVTEPVVASLADVLDPGSRAGLPPAAREALRSQRPSRVERLHGLLCLAEALAFLHAEARLAHRGLSPEAAYVSESGRWKLAGFEFALELREASGGGRARERGAFDYSDAFPSPLSRLARPLLDFTAPELVGGAGLLAAAPSLLGEPDGGFGPASPPEVACDVFSLACLAFFVLAGRPLFPPSDSQNANEHLQRVSGAGALLSCEAQALGDAEAAAQLPPLLTAMLRSSPASRPCPTAFREHPYFLQDIQVRALAFLGSLLSKDAAQKRAFLRDLPRVCAGLDARVLNLFVILPLLLELRNPEHEALPAVLALSSRQSPSEFARATLPALQPLLAHPSPRTLFLLLEAAPALQQACPEGLKSALVLPLLLRGLAAQEQGLQERALRQAAGLGPALPAHALVAELLPAVAELCQQTTSGAIRVAGLEALAALAPCAYRGRGGASQPPPDPPGLGGSLGASVRSVVGAALGGNSAPGPGPAPSPPLPGAPAPRQSTDALLLSMLQSILAVDRSPATAVSACALGLAIARTWGPGLAAGRVLPVLAPVLGASALDRAQFGICLRAVREVLDGIEAARGTGAGGGSTPPPVSQSAFGGRAAAAEGPPRHAPAAPARAALDDWVGVPPKGGGGGGKRVGAGATPGGADRGIGTRQAASCASPELVRQAVGKPAVTPSPGILNGASVRPAPSSEAKPWTSSSDRNAFGEFASAPPPKTVDPFAHCTGVGAGAPPARAGGGTGAAKDPFAGILGGANPPPANANSLI